jgi:GcrA cell cycle regulator
MRGHVWRQDELKILHECWAAGTTADVIGARLGGLSRSAVLGKIFRLRLKAVPAKRKPAAASIDPTLARRRKSPQRIKQTPPPVKQHKTVFELTNASCRWPHGRPGTAAFHFCAEPEADLERGIPYCPRHMRRAYAVTPVPKAVTANTAGALFRWR